MNNGDGVRVLHITHTDLDGWGCCVLTHFIFTDEEIEEKHIFPQKLVETLKGIENPGSYSMIIVSDLAIDQEAYDILKDLSSKTLVLGADHHLTSVVSDSNNILLSVTCTYDEKFQTCGTELLYEIYKNLGWLHETNALDNFVECVRAYDTFSFDRGECSETMSINAPRLNTLFYILGGEKFVEYATDSINESVEDLTHSSERNNWVDMIIDTQQKSDNEYATAMAKRVVVFKKSLSGIKDDEIIDEDYKIGFLMADKLGPFIAKTIRDNPDVYPEMDMVCIVNPAFRSGTFYRIRDGVDVSIPASLLGGGGHRAAAGFGIDQAVKLYLLEYIFNSLI